MIAEAMARFFRQRRCSAAVGTSFILLAIFTFFTMHLLGLNSATQQSLFHRPATKASEKLPEMTSYQPSQPPTTQNNGDELQVPIVSDLEIIDAIHRPITLISDLPKKHIPSVTNPSPLFMPSPDVNNSKRLIVIGDTHGRLTTLQSLLDKISFNNLTDHLVLAGDLVTKGPDSPGLVQFAEDIGASAVRGNHDDHVLEAAKWLSSKKHGKKWWGKAENEGDSISDDEEEVPENEEAEDSVDTANRRRHKRPKGVKAEHIAVARSLRPSQLHWLASQPIILRVGHIFGARTAPWNAKEVVVVHGGLIPSLPLDKQDPWAVMNMRSLVYELATSSAPDNNGKNKMDGNINTASHKRITTIPLDTREGEPWSRAWNRYQNLISNSSKRLVVVYGHDARSGLQVNKDITIKLGKSPIPISRRQITGTGDQTVNVTAGGDVEIEIETEVEIESESEVEINVYPGGTVMTTTTTTTSTGTVTQTVTTGAARSDDDDDDDDDDNDSVASTLSTTTTTSTVTNAPTTVAATAKRSPDGGNNMDAERSKKRPKKFKGTRYAYGLDSGCGHGRQLTALVLEVNENGDDIVHRIEQVECE